MKKGAALYGLFVGDTVRLKQRSNVPLWTVHELHEPTLENERALVSVRPLGMLKGERWPGWPPHTYITIPLDDIEARSRGRTMKWSKVKKAKVRP